MYVDVKACMYPWFGDEWLSWVYLSLFLHMFILVYVFTRGCVLVYIYLCVVAAPKRVLSFEKADQWQEMRLRLKEELEVGLFVLV